MGTHAALVGAALWLDVSVCKTRDASPVYVMFTAMCLATTASLAESPKPSMEEQLVASFQIGQKYGLIGGLIGSAATVQGIAKARSNVEASES